VNLDKLAKQLRRDLSANPKKAAALGLMVVVALYCWGPLVWGWLKSGKGNKPDQAQLAKLILADDPLEPADKAKSRSKATFRWENVRPLLARDPRMVSATFDDVWIDPFGKPAATTEASGESNSDGTPVTAGTLAADATPADLGLVLSSVAIGTRRRAATISGERYEVGDEFTPKGKDSSLPAVKVRVVKITPQGVELDCCGRTLVLRLERSRLASGDEIEHSSRSRGP
jgi:hypothetical protein